MKKKIFIAIGLFCVTLGTIGIFVPILPTTPFFLLASFLFSKSSRKFYDKLINNKYLGDYIRDYLENKTMPTHSKITTLVILWMGIGVSIFLLDFQKHTTIFLIIVAIAVTIHIVLIGRKKSKKS